MIKTNNKNFLLHTKPKIVFQLENSVQFGRQAKRGNPQIVDFFSVVPPPGLKS